MYPDKSSFLAEIKSCTPNSLLDDWFSGEKLPHAFKSQVSLEIFYKPILEDWKETENLAISGTGSWRFSLNPQKNFSEFSETSDIDVVNVSVKHFNEIWERIRTYHRKRWYLMSSYEKGKLTRNGQNIYCGFVSPKWIPDESDELRFKFVSRLEIYSTSEVGFRNVNMLFFKNFDDAKDYYRRGIEIAKNKV